MITNPMSEIVETFEKSVTAAIHRLPRGSTFLAAVSGGADSCAMLAALARIRTAAGYTLHCAHVVHGIRPAEQGETEAALVQALCEQLSVPCAVLHIANGLIVERSRTSKKGLEDAARYYRHRALRSEADRVGADRILLGHTENDLLETTVMRFLRGSGPAGLAAMPLENGLILRPLIGLARSDVIAYLSALHISFAEDPSNSDPRYMRNRIRNRLVPLLDAEFPGWRTAVRSLADSQAKIARYIASEARKEIRWDVSPYADDALETDRGAFFGVDQVVRTEALFQGIDEVAAALKKNEALPNADPPVLKDRDPARNSVDRFASGSAKAQNLGRVRALNTEKKVVLEPAVRRGLECGFCLVIAKAGLYRFGDIEICVDGSAGEDAVRLALPLVVRSSRVSELARLRSRFRGFHPGTRVRFLAEDTSGTMVLALDCGADKLKLLQERGKRRVTDYADYVFFSIL